MKKQIVFLCVGTSKVAGDSLAPRVGDKLIESNLPCYVYGVSNNNVNRKNLLNYLCFIQKMHPNCILITIDAGLSKKQPIGIVDIAKGGISPARAITKKTFKIGDIGILGVVGEYTGDVLKTLSGVSEAFIERFSECIAEIIVNCLKTYYFNEFHN